MIDMIRTCLKVAKENAKMAEEIDNITITRGSGNVFADMGLPNPEERLVKARLARPINKAIKERGWKQSHTAKVLGITQPKVSDISRGRLKNFSVCQILLLYLLSDSLILTLETL